MVECGKVIKIEKKNKVRVSFDRKSACDQCHMCAVTKGGKTVEIVVPNTVNAEVGDDVLVAMGERYVITAAFIVYVIPLLLAALGLGVGTMFSEAVQLILMFVGLAAGFTVAAVLDKKVIRKKKGFVPEITKILQKAGEEITAVSDNDVSDGEKTIADEEVGSEENGDGASEKSEK